MPNPELQSPQSAVNPLATLPNPPPALPIWAKVVYYIVETIAIGVGFSKFDWGKSILAAGGGEAVGDPQTWRRFSFKWQDTVSTDDADNQYFNIDIANITNGDIDGTWTQADYDAVFGALSLMVTSMSASISTRYWCEHVSSYVMAYNPYSLPKPFAHSGSPEAVHAVGVTGTAGGSSAPQVCSTVTEETPVRANWGRFYSPTIGGTAIDTSGRFITANVDALATAVHDCYEDLMSNQFFPVVPATSSAKQPLRALQTVTGVRVDDVLDVHRSRRHHIAAHRKILPLPS